MTTAIDTSTCITRWIIAQPGNRKIQVVLDTQYAISEQQLGALIKDCFNKVTRMQTQQGKGVATARGLVNEDRCHWVSSQDCFVLTDSEDFANECFEALSPKSASIELVGGSN